MNWMLDWLVLLVAAVALSCMAFHVSRCHQKLSDLNALIQRMLRSGSYEGCEREAREYVEAQQ